MKLNPLGYPVVSDEIHGKLFGTVNRPSPPETQLDRAISHLEQYGVPIPVSFPDSLYDGPLPLPGLSKGTIEEHFEFIAEQQISSYKEAANDFAQKPLPPIPSAFDLQLNSGWTRYTPKPGGGFKAELVPFPQESAFTFDTETFVHGGSLPIIGTAVSSEAVYLWLADEFIDETLPEEKWVQGSLIPLGTDSFVIGHNISYDRVRVREGYSLDRQNPENFYFDTLSAHVGVAGLAAGQRFVYHLQKKDKSELTFEEQSALKHAGTWTDYGSFNSLVETYNHHVYKERSFFDENAHQMKDSDKKTRDLFVTAKSMADFAPVRAKLLDYALEDAYRTAELFQALWPKYLRATPSNVGLCGHYHLNGSIIPLDPRWEEWLDDVDRVYDEHNEEMSQICLKLVWETYEQWKSSKKPGNYVTSDPWLNQLDWEVKTQKGKYAGVPQWMRPFIKNPDEKISTKSRLSHLLLKLKWEGCPITYFKDKGWCYQDTAGVLTKIPHPKGTGENVGILLTKEFVDDMAVGRLSSDLPEAQRALDIANATSYWTSVRKRVRERIFMLAHNPYGDPVPVTLPEIIAHGTVTRRTVEPLMVTMCSTKAFRIGTELKSRVQAPPGWRIVGADFDGQEMQIAASYCDSFDSQILGGSPMGFNVLSGSKEHGTDPHSALAKKVGVDRDTAKIAGFAMLYGAGAKAITTYIRRKYPEKPDKAVKDLAVSMLKAKKGFKSDEDGIYKGGSDSGCYNFMERIAKNQKIPTLPCLGTRISEALYPERVGSQFATGRTNWTIQASGSEILATILTATHWLMREYKIPARFIISIHDEIHWMVPEKYAEIFAVLYQMAHIYTWARFHAALDMHDMPLSRAYFSSVAIDYRIRKSPDQPTVTISNPQGANEPFGEEYTMAQLYDRGAVKKLQTRYELIQKGLI